MFPFSSDKCRCSGPSWPSSLPDVATHSCYLRVYGVCLYKQVIKSTTPLTDSVRHLPRWRSGFFGRRSRLRRGGHYGSVPAAGPLSRRWHWRRHRPPLCSRAAGLLAADSGLWCPCAPGAQRWDSGWSPQLVSLRLARAPTSRRKAPAGDVKPSAIRKPHPVTSPPATWTWTSLQHSQHVYSKHRVFVSVHVLYFWFLHLICLMTRTYLTLGWISWRNSEASLDECVTAPCTEMVEVHKVTEKYIFSTKNMVWMYFKDKRQFEWGTS